jgi:hypothetical protein
VFVAQPVQVDGPVLITRQRLVSRESDGGGLATTLVSVITPRGSLWKDDRTDYGAVRQVKECAGGEKRKNVSAHSVLVSVREFGTGLTGPETDQMQAICCVGPDPTSRS